MSIQDEKLKSLSRCNPQIDQDRCFSDVDLLSPLTIRKVNLRNRIAVSPMCQYIAKDGFADDWHLVHLGSRAVGGAGLVFTEATSVTKQGRITPGDLGLWDDAHIEPLKRITQFIHRMDAIAGIQLAHSGRKGGCEEPWKGGRSLSKEQGGWDLVAPSSIPFSDASSVPAALSKEKMYEILLAFKAAAKRGIEAGYDLIEVHSAHGYLLHEFLSPLSNQRTDEYGESLENRMRFPCEVIQAVRSVMPETMPLFVRISATDWVEGGWDIEQSIQFASTLCPMGVDLIDCSSEPLCLMHIFPWSGISSSLFGTNSQKSAYFKPGAVGLITEPEQANDVITSGKADLVLLAREFLREPYWALKAEQKLNQESHYPLPYGYAVHRRK